MKKVVLIGLLIVFLLTLTACHTLTGALIGGGLGGIIGGRGGAVIGTAIGAGVGNELDMAEMKAAGISPYSYPQYGYGRDYSYSGNCNIFPPDSETRLQCERGREDTRQQLQYLERQRAYDYGRGYRY